MKRVKSLVVEVRSRLRGRSQEAWSCRTLTQKSFGMFVVLSLLGCVSATDLHAADRGESSRVRPSSKTRVVFTACTEECFSIACFQGCVAEFRAVRAEAARFHALLPQAFDAESDIEQTPVVAEALNSALSAALSNLHLCEDRYLNVDDGVVDENGYRSCAWAVAQFYVNRAAELFVDPAKRISNSISIDAIGRGLDLVSRVTEITLTAAEGAVAALAENGVAAAGGNEETPQSGFSKCLDKFDANRMECDERYPNGSAALTACLEATEIALKECVKKNIAQ